MERKGIANFLTSYLDGDTRVKVLNINAPWGTGKTFFLRNWSQQEFRQGRACIYFNAWEADYSGDAFVSLVSTIRDQLEDIIGFQSDAEHVLKDFTKKASKTLVAATPALAKGILKKFTGIELSIIADIIDNDQLGDAAEKAVEELIKSNKETLATVKDFKHVLNKLLRQAAEKCATGGSVKVAYIYIDELDRCRPTFAIELLERIKHLFDVDSCRFIIATDTSQLGEAVRAVYGNGFDSGKYLRRFFDREYSLSNIDFTSWIKAKCIHFERDNMVSLGLRKRYTRLGRPSHAYNLPNSMPHPDTELAADIEITESQLVILSLANTFKPSLRDLDKIICHLEAVQSGLSNQPFHFFWAAYLVFLKIEAPDIYSTSFSGSYAGAIADLMDRYPARYLYFGSVSRSVHAIFETYIGLYRNGRNNAQETARRSTDEELQYVTTAIMEFANEFERMKLYPTFVNLAYSME